MYNVEAVELMNQMILGHRFEFHSAGTMLFIVIVLVDPPTEFHKVESISGLEWEY